jgi:biopolymer transport protein ExbD
MKRFDSINVIPFIDIMLVLLAIVLMTTSFIANNQMSIELPEASSTSAQVNNNSVDISVDKNLTIYFNKVAVGLDLLRENLSKLNKNTPIKLRIDSSVSFKVFVSVVDVLKLESLHKVSIQTRR